MVYWLGRPVNHFDKELEVEMELGEAQEFCSFNKESNSLTVDGNLVTEDSIGHYKLYVTASEVHLGQKYEY